MNESDTAVATFRQGFNCAQSMLSTFAGRFGLGREEALKLGAGLGGGMCFLGQACGAVTGAFLVLGLEAGSAVPADAGSKKAVQDLVQEFARRFIARSGSLNCNELMGCDMCDPQVVARARQEGRFARVCAPLVGQAATILQEMLDAAAPAS